MNIRFPRSLVVLRPVVVLLALGWPLVAGEPIVVTRDSVGTFYKGFKRLTGEPRSMLPNFVFCRAPSAEEVARGKDLGPHAQTWVHFYVNESAAQVLAEQAAVFPVGAVIVKEKLGDGKTVTGVAGMIKRAAGYDARNGDWEFFYHTPGGEFSSGKIASCVDCHNGARRDHVFGLWKISGK